MKSVTVVEVDNIAYLPPAQNLVRILLADGYKVNLIGNNLLSLAEDIRKHHNYRGYELPQFTGKTLLNKLINKTKVHFTAIKYVRACMAESDYLWTASMQTIVYLGKEVFKYKNIMQLMELAECFHMHGLIRIPLRDFALHAWKVVTVEINRAYIQRIWWDLPNLPAVLPNKPFSLDYGELTPELEKAVQRMKGETKKIVFYLGVVGYDRDLIQFADAIRKLDDYAFYFAGLISSKNAENIVRILEKEYGATYLGRFDPPKHLTLVQYAHIGLLPYKPVKSPNLPELNALYCAPNKIWEYAGFGVPMVGSDVLGLKFPFEQWNIGCCCDINDELSIGRAIKYVDARHDEMSKNCYKFYDSVDLHKIVAEILEDET